MSLGIILSGCKRSLSGDTAVAQQTDSSAYIQWDINTEYVEMGCQSGFDCIKSIDHPVFIAKDAVDFLEDSDMVMGVLVNGIVKCYPHPVLDWHEIVNDSTGNTSVFINYCPLTGSGMAWDRTIDGEKTSFGVSGLLFNSNIMPYDRETESIWSQMKMECVNGKLYQHKPVMYPVLETTWKTWKKCFPDAPVLSTNTGYSRGYGEYPYGSYREDMDIYFSTENDDPKIHPKERLYGITDGKNAVCYRFRDFEKGIQLVSDAVNGKSILVAGSADADFIVAFEIANPGDYIPLQNHLPAIIADKNGNEYDLFGNCMQGDKTGTHLQPVNGFIAYWFSWIAFYPDLRVK